MENNLIHSDPGIRSPVTSRITSVSFSKKRVEKVGETKHFFFCRKMRSMWNGLLLVSMALPWLMCLAAPHAEFSGDLGFQEFASKNMEFARRIRAGVLALSGVVHEALGIKSQSELMTIETHMGIQQVDASHCKRKRCDVERCFNQLQAGLQTYSNYLSHVRQILTTYNDRIYLIQHAISHLSYNIEQEMELRGLTSVVYPQAKNVPTFLERRGIGSYLVLYKLKLFMETIFRALRHCST